MKNNLLLWKTIGQEPGNFTKLLTEKHFYWSKDSKFSNLNIGDFIFIIDKSSRTFLFASFAGDNGITIVNDENNNLTTVFDDINNEIVEAEGTRWKHFIKFKILQKIDITDTDWLEDFKFLSTNGTLYLYKDLVNTKSGKNKFEPSKTVKLGIVPRKLLGLNLNEKAEEVLQFSIDYVSTVQFSEVNINTTKKQKVKRKNKSIKLKIDQSYSKIDLYNLFGVIKKQRGGKWNNGYCEHNDDWFIFANIGLVGRGYVGGPSDIEFNYSNSFDIEGSLDWEAINSSRLHWESIQKLKSSSPFIFIRTPNTEKNKWKYTGRGECSSIKDTSPVQIKWEIKTHNNYKQKETSTQYCIFGDEFLRVKEILNTNPFAAFDLYKKTVLNKNPKISNKDIKIGFNEFISS